MNEQQAARWAKTRDKGRNKYIVTFGMLTIGVCITLLLSIMEFISNNEITPMYVVVRFFVFSVIGIILSNKTWERNERRFQAYTSASGAKGKVSK
ncbi:hypothetical protein E0485_19800 [Paenibacillus albiflavus]|uniref:Uncharacterized protein n=1 Tax=Paenibacillus albiflavus TaxID=2545760 RepID=A0A4R4E5S8_9BACL|nr:hypothetical protein [Paenibacillus albiflavus]TCZ74233.1 hypothetical protein E0485_19800 [Paenibacillus albiflavus]